MYSRVRFNLRVGEGEHLTESGVRDEFSDMDGKSFGWRPRAKFSDCVSHGLFKLMVEMVSVNTVSLFYYFLFHFEYLVLCFHSLFLTFLLDSKSICHK